jgi:hypothetical protein
MVVRCAVHLTEVVLAPQRGRDGREATRTVLGRRWLCSYLTPRSGYRPGTGVFAVRKSLRGQVMDGAFIVADPARRNNADPSLAPTSSGLA